MNESQLSTTGGRVVGWQEISDGSRKLRGIAIRAELTDEWKKRNVKEDREYLILTAEISSVAFDLTPTEYKDLKGLKRENLQDHMNDWN
jgi:hypothetical protein